MDGASGYTDDPESFNFLVQAALRGAESLQDILWDGPSSTDGFPGFSADDAASCMSNAKPLFPECAERLVPPVARLLAARQTFSDADGTVWAKCDVVTVNEAIQDMYGADVIIDPSLWPAWIREDLQQNGPFAAPASFAGGEAWSANLYCGSQSSFPHASADLYWSGS